MATRKPFDPEDTDMGAGSDGELGNDDGWNASEFDEPTAPGSPVPELATMIAAPLPEMEAEIWQAEIHALVSVSDGTEPSWPAAASWANEARLLRAESELAEGPGEAAGLLLAAARAAEYAGISRRRAASSTRRWCGSRTRPTRCGPGRASARGGASSTTRTPSGRGWRRPPGAPTSVATTAS